MSERRGKGYRGGSGTGSDGGGRGHIWRGRGRSDGGQRANSQRQQSQQDSYTPVQRGGGGRGQSLSYRGRGAGLSVQQFQQRDSIVVDTPRGSGADTTCQQRGWFQGSRSRANLSRQQRSWPRVSGNRGLDKQRTSDETVNTPVSSDQSSAAGSDVRSASVPFLSEHTEKHESPVVQPDQPAPSVHNSGKKSKRKKERKQTDTAAKETMYSASEEKGTEDIASKLNIIPSRKTAQKHLNFYERPPMSIEVNYLKLKFNNSLKIFHYDCLFDPERPKALFRTAMSVFRERHFANRHPGYDGNRNLYFGGKKLDISGDTLTDTVEVFDDARQRNKNFKIKIMLVKELNFSALSSYIRNGITFGIPRSVIQATDVALRQSLVERSDLLFPAGRSFFRLPLQQSPAVDLTGGFELWRGHYQSAIIGKEGAYLNIDVSNKAFPKNQSVLDFIRTEFRNIRREDLYEKIHKYLNNLKIEYRMPSTEPPFFYSKRVYKCNGIDLSNTGSATMHRFAPTENGPEITVQHFFQREKNYTIQYPELPLVCVREKRFPLELCYIISKQDVRRKLDSKQISQMVRNAARPTYERQRDIVESIRIAAFNENQCVSREFEIGVNTNFVQVQAYVLKPPQLLYRGNTPASVSKGTWNGGQFIDSPGLKNWIVINMDKNLENYITRVVSIMGKCGKDLGVDIANPMEVILSFNIKRTLEDVAYKYRSGLQLIFIIMSSQDPQYGAIKGTTELLSGPLSVGLLTQCIKAETIVDRNRRFKFTDMIAKNILLKINAKINGTNDHLYFPSPTLPEPEILKEPVLFLGADVTHFTDSNFPSIAAITASHDLVGFKYNMSYLLQHKNSKKKVEEMIRGLAPIVKDKLEFFKEKTGKEAKKIVYFRDGVSEGQFQQVLEIELEEIKQACKRIRFDYEPKITFVVVQKRHHTRFFPKDFDDGTRNKNVLVGTLVDNTITHPTELNFYLVSHQSIQGTARPTKYHLLYDENDFWDEELQRLTYYLCHMFARCNRSVSYPAPTYYAHLAAFRARAWFENVTDPAQTPIHGNINENNPMFFI